MTACVRFLAVSKLRRKASWLNSNKGTKSDMGVCPSRSALESYTYVEPPIIGPIQGQFWELGSESRVVAGDMVADITEPLATCWSRSIVLRPSLLANNKARSLSP
jgi:hypothetical protein